MTVMTDLTSLKFKIKQVEVSVWLGHRENSTVLREAMNKRGRKDQPVDLGVGG